MERKLLIHPDELGEDWIDRAVKLGIDTLALHPVGGKQALGALEELLARLETKDYTALIDRAIDAGLSFEYELHAGAFLAPRSLFAAHPEWFRENRDGVRTDDCNFCPSSEEMLEIVEARTAELAKKLYRSTTHRYFLWLDDEKYSECHCARCRGLSPSDQQMKILNRMLNGLRRVDPEATLAYLAYFQCITPPRKVSPEDGIFLEYAPFERRMSIPASEQSVGAELDDLLTVFPRKGMSVLEYWYDNSMFSGWKKPPKPFTPNNDLIRDDLAFYRHKGAETAASFACYFGKDYTERYGEPDLSAFRKGK